MLVSASQAENNQRIGSICASQLLLLCCCVNTEAGPVCVCPTGCPSSCTTFYQGRRRCALELSLVVSSLVPYAFTKGEATAPIAFFPGLPQSLDVVEV